MNYLDLGIIIALCLSLFAGYKRGFYKEFYNLILMIMAIVFSYIFRNPIGNICFNLFVPDNMKNEKGFQMLKSMIIPAIGIIVAYLIFYIIFKIILAILVKNETIPNDPDYFRYGGSFISLGKTLFILSAMAFSLSFLSYAKIDYYDKSLLIKPIFKLDPPLYNLSVKLHTIIDNSLDMMKNAKKYQTDPNNIFTDPKSAETIELLFETGILNDDVVVEGSKNLLKDIDTKKLKLNEINFDEIKNTEQFTYFKDLYKKDILNENLINRIVSENNLTDLNVEELISALAE